MRNVSVKSQSFCQIVIQHSEWERECEIIGLIFWELQKFNEISDYAEGVKREILKAVEKRWYSKTLIAQGRERSDMCAIPSIWYMNMDSFSNVKAQQQHAVCVCVRMRQAQRTTCQKIQLARCRLCLHNILSLDAYVCMLK
jgi:hypothetical protein